MSEQEQIYVHTQPRFVFVGRLDPEDWLVGFELSEEAQKMITDGDRELMGRLISTVVRSRMAEKKKGLIVLPGTGLSLAIPGTKINGGKK